MNQYATHPQLVERVPGLANRGVLDVDDALIGASRWIDGYCHRKFWLDPEPTIRYFATSDLYRLNLGPHEIGDATGVDIDVDDGTGAFATQLAGSAYQLEPVNAPFNTKGPAPFTSVRRLDAAWPYALSASGRQERIRITARYGWPEIPAGVHEATLTLTIDRFENPGGARSEAIDGYSVSYQALATVTPMLAFARRLWAA